MIETDEEYLEDFRYELEIGGSIVETNTLKTINTFYLSKSFKYQNSICVPLHFEIMEKKSLPDHLMKYHEVYIIIHKNVKNNFDKVSLLINQSKISYGKHSQLLSAGYQLPISCYSNFEKSVNIGFNTINTHSWQTLHRMKDIYVAAYDKNDKLITEKVLNNVTWKLKNKGDELEISDPEFKNGLYKFTLFGGDYCDLPCNSEEEVSFISNNILTKSVSVIKKVPNLIMIMSGMAGNRYSI